MYQYQECTRYRGTDYWYYQVEAYGSHEPQRRG